MSSGTFRVPADPKHQRPSPTADASASSSGQEQGSRRPSPSQQQEPPRRELDASQSSSSRQLLADNSGTQVSSTSGEGEGDSNEYFEGMRMYRHPNMRPGQRGRGEGGGGSGSGGDGGGSDATQQSTQLIGALDTTQPFALDATQPVGMYTSYNPQDEEEEEIDQGQPFARLEGDGDLADVILYDKMHEVVFGGSVDCDVRLPQTKLGLNPKAEKSRKPWFRLILKQHGGRKSIRPIPPSVYIEDLSGFGTFLGKRQITKPQLLKWADHIKGSPERMANAFHYVFKYNKKDDDPFTVEGQEGTYRVHADLGNGAYSIVRKAVDVKDENLVYACKDIDTSKREFSTTELENMEHEVEVLRTVHHRNIIKFVDEARIGSHIYIFTEYFDGITLRDYCRQESNFVDETAARNITKQICKALNYLHGIGVVHRDIKSENVMVDRDLMVKLIDFGLARSLSASEPLKNTCGTYAYMAPEIAQGEDRNAYGTPVDVWSTGVLLFRMIAGRYPFNDGTDSPDDAVVSPHAVEQHEVKLTADTSIVAKPSSPVHSNHSGDASQSSKPQNKELSPEQQQQQQQQQEKMWGKVVDYNVDWTPHVDDVSRRTNQLKDFLNRLLILDPSRRITMAQALQHDWMALTDEQLEIMETHINRHEIIPEHDDVESIPSDQASQAWAQLNIIPGSISGPPERIYLTKDKTYFGRTMGVDVFLAVDRFLSSYQCLIMKEEDGTVTLVDNGVNPSYINNLRLGRGMAGQIFSGDIIGFIVPGDDLGGEGPFVRPRDENQRFLKYRFVMNSAPEILPSQAPKRRLAAMEDEVMRRSCRNYDLKMKERIRLELESQKAARLMEEMNLDEWGTLVPLNDPTKEVQLRGRTVSIGRSLDATIHINHINISRRHCQLRWEEPAAFIEATGRNSILVSGHEVKGSMQLRDGDSVILVVNPDGEDIGYKFYYSMDQYQMGPRAKRIRDE